MRILITGATGFIGHHVVEHLQSEHEIVGLVSYRHRGCPLRAENFGPNVRLLYCDLRGPVTDRVAEAIGPVEVILNLASESHVDRSIADPVPFIENNVAVALNMLEYARKAKPRLFFQVSTDEVYGPARIGDLHAEWSTILPSNPYAASKAAQEAIAISYWRTYGVPVVITNTMNNIGERQDREKFLPMTISRVLRDEEVIIHGSPGNIGSRFYMHARNHADALGYLMHSDATRYPQMDRPDRYNIVGDIEIDNLQMASRVADILGKPLHYRLEDFHATRPGHDRRYALDGSKMTHVGWQSPVSFEESLYRTVRWTVAHPEWLR